MHILLLIHKRTFCDMQPHHVIDRMHEDLKPCYSPIARSLPIGLIQHYVSHVKSGFALQCGKRGSPLVRELTYGWKLALLASMVFHHQNGVTLYQKPNVADARELLLICRIPEVTGSILRPYASLYIYFSSFKQRFSRKTGHTLPTSSFVMCSLLRYNSRL